MERKGQGQRKKGSGARERGSQIDGTERKDMKKRGGGDSTLTLHFSLSLPFKGTGAFEERKTEREGEGGFCSPSFLSL
jgi:hypothetical protein